MQLSEKPWPITARQLLAHQSGIRNWTREEFHNTRRFTSITESLEPFKDDALLFEPATSTQYSSLGFTLLGAVMEGAGGAPFMDQLRASVFQPAGMESARDDELPLLARQAALLRVNRKRSSLAATTRLLCATQSGPGRSSPP